MPHKLLLADDSVTIQRVIELTFADEDVHVIAVGDGKQAIDRVQQDRPDIVLADVGMPERDGYEVASFIKADPQLAHIPVLLLTGAFEPIDETRARTVGCDGVLVKPFEPQMVINRVRDLLAGRRPAGLWAATPVAQTPVRPPAAAAAAGNADLRPAASGAPAKPGEDSLENYFDRLDAAFGAPADSPPDPPAAAPPAVAAASAAPAQHDYGYRDAVPPAASAAQTPPPRVDLTEWDPDLTGDPSPVARVTAASSSTPNVSDSVSSWNPDLSGRVPAAPASMAAAPPAPPPPAPPPPRAAPSGSAVLPMPPLAEAFAALLAAEQGQPIVPSAHRPDTVPETVVDDIVRRVIDRMGQDAVRRTVVDVAERLVRDEIQKIKSR